MKNAWMLILGLCLLWWGCQVADSGGILPPRPDTRITDPAPFPSQGLTVLIVEDVQSRRQLPLSQLSILTSAKLRSQLAEWQANYRVWDDQLELSDIEDEFRQAYALPRQSLPWIYISNGRRGYSGPLPATVEETLQLIEKYRP